MTSPYAPVDTADGEIRLLTIHPATRVDAPVLCDLEPAKLRDDPEFEALSYTWGNDSPSHDIQLNGTTFKVRDNAAAALRRLRRPKEKRCVWIDAICINQEDARERDRQITLMQDIYGQATQVCIFLGEPTEQGIIGMLYMQGKTFREAWVQYQIERKSDKLIDPTSLGNFRLWDRMDHSDNRMMGEVREIFDRPWWKRTWVIQEAILARKLVVMCGEDEVSWQMVRKLVENRRMSRTKTEVFGIDWGERSAYPDETFRLITEFRQKWHDSASMINVLELLYRCRMLRCSMAQDKIFGFLGIVPSAKTMSIVPDSTRAVADVYREFAYKIIKETRSLDVLNCTREWRSGQRRHDTDVVYSMSEQARYHDVAALVNTGPGKPPKRAWAKLPDGWERLSDAKNPKFLNHLDNKTYDTSPLAGQPPRGAVSFLERRDLPLNWKKKWDNLGRASASYEPGESEEQKILRESANLVADDLFQLPSWVPNWYTPTAWDPQPLVDFAASDQQYWAGGHTFPRIVSELESPHLTLDGFMFDEIESISPPWHPQSEIPPLSRKGIQPLIEWEELATQPVNNCPYGQSHAGRKNATWRTMIADAAGRHATPPGDEIFIEMWYDREGWTHDLPELLNVGVLDVARKGIAAVFAMEYKVGEAYDAARPLVADPDVREDRKTHDDVSKTYGMYLQRVHKVCAHRRLFVTKKGYIGLAPWNAGEGGVVCVLRGGKTPYILRRSGSRTFEFVGEGYVYGVMAGESLKMGYRGGLIKIG